MVFECNFIADSEIISTKNAFRGIPEARGSFWQ